MAYTIDAQDEAGMKETCGALISCVLHLARLYSITIAHLILAPWFCGWPDPGLTFDVALHVGTLMLRLIIGVAAAAQ